MNRTIALLFAGGSGTRMGLSLPKQFVEVDGKPILAYTVELFEHNPVIDGIYVVTVKEYIDTVWEMAKRYGYRKIQRVCEGGASAQESIYNGLKAVEEDSDDNPIVLLHDGVRPFVDSDVITKNVECVKKNGNAITCIPCYETILRSEDGSAVSGVLIRKETFTGQAPQGFYLRDILSAHEEIRKRENGYENMVDACTIYNELGRKTYMVMGNRGNIKITTKEDLYVLKAFLQLRKDEEEA